MLTLSLLLTLKILKSINPTNHSSDNVMQVAINIDIKENYFSDFEVFSELYGKSFPVLRREAMDEFSRIGFPTIRNEEWKYTNISPLLK